tara:strand:- start:150 stop:1523 length:1374 start_codon:yes stop_codon:yes gene_type:complete
MRVAVQSGNDQIVREMVDHWPYRLFSGMKHTVDGVTIAESNQPYADRFFQARYLKENTVSNMQNIEAQLTQTGIFTNTISHIDEEETEELDANDVESYTSFALPPGNTTPVFTTVMFQPPFDFWTKHQRCSGGNHQIQLNLRPSIADRTLLGVARPNWGQYCAPFLPGITIKNASFGPTLTLFHKHEDFGSNSANGAVRLWIDRIRLSRRMVRFNIERPLKIQEFNLTQMQFFQGASITLNRDSNGALYTTGPPKEQAQNFLLPSSTFGVAFYWKHSQDTQNTPLGPQGSLGDINSHVMIKAALQDRLSAVQINDFYFSYGGVTYPAERITDIGANDRGNLAVHPGMQQIQFLSHQLQGAFNMPMNETPFSFLNQRGIRYLNDKLFYFPVAKHSNSDNSDIQIHYTAALASRQAKSGDVLNLQVPINLVVVAFYDARVELSYNSMNQLEKVTKTEWK